MILPEGHAWFLGNDWRKRTAIEKSWRGRLWFSPIGERANPIAWRIADQIINIDSQVVPHHQRAWWLASDIGDRGPYVSSLFERTSWYLALLDLLAEGGTHVVVVEDRNFARMLYGEISAQGYRTSWLSAGRTRPLIDRLREKAMAFARVTKMVLSRMARTWQALALYVRIRRYRRQRPLRIDQLKAADVIVMAWNSADTFTSDKPAETLYGLGALPSILREAGLKVGFLAMPIDWIVDGDVLVRQAINAADPILLLEDCISFADIVGAAVGTSLLRSRLNRTLKIDGRDLSGVFRLALEEELTRWRPVRSKLFERVGSALAAMGITPRAIIYAHEGQPWEKSLAHGVRVHLVSTRLVGYQCAPFAPLHISFFPSLHDIASGDAPDHILMSGEEYLRWFAERGFPWERLSNAGALRRPTFGMQAAGLARPGTMMPVTVICSCSILAEESWELLDKSVAVVRGLDNVVLIVNFHPLTPSADREKTIAWIQGSPEFDATKVRFSDESFAKLAAQGDIVFCDRSGVVFEALALGIPVVNVMADSSLELNKVRADDIPTCRTVDEIRQAFQRSRGLRDTDLADIVSRHLSAVRPEAIVAVLK